MKVHGWMIKAVCLIMIFLYILTAGAFALELPEIYQRTYLEWKVGDTVNVGDMFSITITDYARCSYAEFIESIDGVPIDGAEDSDYPLYCISVTSLIENISEEDISGEQLKSYLSTAYFRYPFDFDTEQKPDEFIGWVSNSATIASNRNYSLYGLNTSYDAMKVSTDGEKWDDMSTIENITLHPGESVKIVDMKGHVNEARHQSYLSTLAYMVATQKETVLICLEELSIDLNQDEYVDCPMNNIELYTINAAFFSCPSCTYEQLYRFERVGQYEGTAALCEQVKICQEVFEMEPTGIVDQEFINRLMYYNVHN